MISNNMKRKIATFSSPTPSATMVSRHTIVIGQSQNAGNPSMKSGFRKEPVCQVVMIYLVRYIRPVITVESVWFTGSGFYVPGAVSFFLDVWIVKRINVDGKAKSVLGNLGSGAGHEAEVER